MTRTLAGVALACALLLASCSGEPASAPTPEPAPRTGGSSGPGPSSTQPPSPSGSPGPTPRAPRVLVIHHTRSLNDVPLGLARRLEDRRVRTWRALDGSDDRLRMVRGVAGVARDRNAVAFVTADRVRPWVRAVGIDGDQPFAGLDDVVTLTVGGDVMLDRGVASAMPPGRPTDALRPLRQLLSRTDLTVVNLESALSEDGNPQQHPFDDSFAAPPSVLPALADLGIDAISLANNHTGDYGTRALLDTVAAVRDSPVAGFGAGADLVEASRPAVLEAAGVSIGLVGFNAIGETPQAAPGVPGALSVRMPPRTGPLDEGDLRHVLSLVRRLDREVDAVVVLPHWGDQYTHVPWPSQRFVARRLARAGADLVAGGHPHWVQGLERAGDAVVAHSLGNLVFDMDFMEQTMEGVLLEATFAGSRLVAVDLVPYRMDSSFRPRPVGGAEAADILGDVRSTSTGPFR